MFAAYPSHALRSTPLEPPLGPAPAPPAPRTPSARARRLLFAYPPAQSIFGAFGLVSLVLAFLVYQVFASGVPADVALALFGSKTSGTVAGHVLDTRMSVDNVHPTRFDFTYGVRGKTFSGRSYAFTVPPQLAYVTSADVEYLPFAPDVGRLAGTTRNEGGDSIGIVLGWLLSFGVASIGFPLWSMRRKRRAFVHGDVARGTITFAGQSSTSINGRRPYKIEWAFTDARQRTYTGSLSAFASTDLPPLTEGQTVTVLYDRNAPSANVVFVD